MKKDFDHERTEGLLGDGKQKMFSFCEVCKIIFASLLILLGFLSSVFLLLD